MLYEFNKINPLPSYPGDMAGKNISFRAQHPMTEEKKCAQMELCSNSGGEWRVGKKQKV